MRSISDVDKAHEALGKEGLRQWQNAQYTKNTTAGATTAAAGDLSGAAITVAEYSAVGAANLTTRTAAQMIADEGYNPGDSYKLEILNSSAGTTTLVGGTGVTITGTATIAAAALAHFVVTVGSDGASMTFQRCS